MKGAPWFPFYPADFLGGTFAMDAAEVGAYVRLLCLQWQGGGLPNDPAKLAALSGHAFASAVASKFSKCPDGLLRNARLEDCRKKASEKSEKATASAVKRWNEEKKEDANAYPNAHANAMRGQRSEVRGHSTEDKGQKTEADGGSKGAEAKKPKAKPVFATIACPETLPANIDAPEVRALIVEWLSMRKATRKPATVRAVAEGIADLAKFGGVPEAVASLKASIMGNWTGLFPPKPDAVKSLPEPKRYDETGRELF